MNLEKLEWNVAMIETDSFCETVFSPRVFIYIAAYLLKVGGE